jgi:surface protein
MFYGCKSLLNIDLSSFNVKNIKKTTLMFDGCQCLRKVKIPEELFLKMSENDRSSLKSATRQLI